jgi:hypothetical protein
MLSTIFNSFCFGCIEVDVRGVIHCKKRMKFRLFLVEIDFDKFIVQS